MSTLGSSIFKLFLHYVGIKILGSYNFDNIKKSCIDSIGGKLLLNISNILTKMPFEFFKKVAKNMNKALSEMLEKYAESYINKEVCYEIDVSKIGMAWRLPIKRMIFYNYFGESSKDNLNKALESYINDNEKYIKDNLTSDIPILNILEKMMDELTNILRDNFIPVLFTGAGRGYLQLNKIFEENFW